MTDAPLPSNRSFGTVFVCFFAILAAYAGWKGFAWYIWAATGALLVLVITLAWPNLLAPFNRAWMQLASILHRIVSPLVLGLIYYGIFMPVGLAMRLAGRDALKRNFDAGLKTYWVERQPPGPPADDLRNQF